MINFDSQEEIVKHYGGYNDSPPNFKEITEKEFAQSHFFTYDPEATDYRQITDMPNEKTTLAVKLFFFHDGSGVGMSSDYWEGKVRYFSFDLCEHEYEELTAEMARELGLMHHGMCWHVIKCRKCGHTQSYDSSG